MSADQQQERALEHDEYMALHKTGMRRAQQGPSPADQARLLDKVTESELETADDGLKNLKAKDFPLSNYDELTDTIEFKWLQEIVTLFSSSRYPHPRSGLQGLPRAWASGDTGNRLESKSLDEYAQDESYRMGTFSRAKRGEGGFQQETSAKQVTESHAIRESSDGAGKGGLLGRAKSRLGR